MRTRVLAPVLLVFSLLITSHGTAVAGGVELISGCLTNSGSLVKLSLGDAPIRPCTSQQVRLSFDVSALHETNLERLSPGRPDFPVNRARGDAAVVLRLKFPF